MGFFEKPILPENSKKEELPERIESLEEEQLRQEFVQVLKKPDKGRFLKMLQRLGVGLALVGLTLSSMPKEAIAPEKSVEIRMMNELDSLDVSNPVHRERLQQIISAIKESVREKGGIPVSPQLPEEIYKPVELSAIVRQEAKEANIPYYSKPEIILGQEFMKEKPALAKHYYERISKAMKATVIIRNESGRGSGAIINTKNGKIIITNNHVIEGGDNIEVEFFNGNKTKGKVLNATKNPDLAILSFETPKPSPGTKQEDFLKGTESLEIEDDSKFRATDSLAMIGHPFGYFFEVSVARPITFARIDRGSAENNLLISTPDPRFTKLATFEIPPHFQSKKLAHKGEAMPGMSGGPVIKLDRGGEPKLAALTVIGEIKQTPDIMGDFSVSGTIDSESIAKFLEESGYGNQKQEVNAGGGGSGGTI